MHVIITTSVFFFNDTATTEIYTLSLHDALPISGGAFVVENWVPDLGAFRHGRALRLHQVAGQQVIVEAAQLHQAEQRMTTTKDRKSTRLNSSHANISYAVFCLKKKKTVLTISFL